MKHRDVVAVVRRSLANLHRQLDALPPEGADARRRALIRDIERMGRHYHDLAGLTGDARDSSGHVAGELRASCGAAAERTFKESGDTPSFRKPEEPRKPEALSAVPGSSLPVGRGANGAPKGRKSQPYDTDAEFLAFAASFPQGRRSGLPAAYRLWGRLVESERQEAIQTIAQEVAEANASGDPKALGFVFNIVKWLERRPWEGRRLPAPAEPPERAHARRLLEEAP